jgi:hypothetical protein
VTTTPPDLRFRYEWTPGDGAVARELAATWARVELWVGDDCITQVEDVETGSSRRSIFCPLYPVAEWIAFNWWLLQANVRPSSISPAFSRASSAQSAWHKHHNLRAAGDGFIWPNCVILPEGEITRVIWHPDRRSTSSTIRYLIGGEAVLDHSHTQLVLAEVVESVLARLEERGIRDSPLADEWSAVTTADAEERDFCLAAARLGLDPYSLEPEFAARLQKLDGELSDGILTDFLDSVNPHKLDAGISWVQRVSRLIEKIEQPPSPIVRDLRREAVMWPEAHERLPWARGYHHAKMARSYFGLDTTERFEHTNVISVRMRSSHDRSLQGLGGVSEFGAGALVLGRKIKRRDSSFAIARSLWHFTFDPSDRFLLTTAHADRQRVERAFAAELLAPADGLREILNHEDGFVTTDDLSDAADHFDVAPYVVRHQVENQLALQVA